jgi:hypothetical protein
MSLPLDGNLYEYRSGSDVFNKTLSEILWHVKDDMKRAAIHKRK